MDHKTLSDMIGLIYDAAFDISYWPRLADMLVREMAPGFSDASAAGNGGGCAEKDCRTLPAEDNSSGNASSNRLPREKLVNLLHSHFERALAMNRQLSEISTVSHALQSVLDRLPLGMLIVDGRSNVIAHNSKLNQLLSDGKGLSIRQGLLSAHSSNDTVRLRKAIGNVSESRCREGEAIQLAPTDSGAFLSVLVLPFLMDHPVDERQSESAIVLVATPETPIEVNIETLISLYQLTKAEAKLTAALVRGRDLNAIAGEFGVSKHTLRNQLKSVYEKTGTHRQAELVRQVMTGPAMLATLCRQDHSLLHLDPSLGEPHRGVKKAARHRQFMTLPDGRRLCYAEYGVTGGRPVMLMHASNGSRLERHPDETIVQRCGIRLIIPDRPGVGLSDINRKMTFGTYARDVACLADHLGLDRFGMIGYSLGGAYALACAYWLKARIERMALAASVAPFDSLGDLEGMYFPCRLLLIFGRYAPVLAKPLARFVGYQVRPESYPEELWRYLPPVDQALVSDVAVRDRIMESARENHRQGGRHVLQEIYNVCGHWGFELDQITTPVQIWHGEKDRVVPTKMASKIARSLPDSRIDFLPGAGHYLLFHCWKDILLSAISNEAAG